MRRLSVFIACLSFATTVLGSVESECAGPASDTEKCLYFFKGYLYGLNEVADRKNTGNPNTAGKRESFMERALRTRLGEAANRNVPERGLPFCIPPDLDVPSVARELQAVFADDTSQWVEESDPLLTALEKTFPCTD